MTAYLAIYEELNRRGIYREVEQSFASKVVMSCAHHLRSTANPQALREIREAICSKEFRATGVLDHPMQYYFEPQSARNVLQVPYILAFEHRMSRSNAAPEVYPGARKGERVDVSVILPIIREEPYLCEALDSMLAQTHENLEIICVADKALVQVRETLFAYAERDSHIHLAFHEKCSLALARNFGLEYASGDYVQFFDCRDLLYPHALEAAYRRALEQELDVVCFDAEAFCCDHALQKECDERSQRYASEHRYHAVYQGEQMLRIMVRDEEYMPLLGQRLIRRAFLVQSGLRFDEQILFAGYHAFHFCCMLAAQRVGYAHERLYRRRICRQREEKPSMCRVLGYFRAYQSMLDFLKKQPVQRGNEEDAGMLIKRILWMAQDQYVRLPELEKYVYAILPADERIRFKMSVCDVAYYKREQLERQRSWLYMAGCALAYFRRKVPDGLYYLREFGVKYTIERFIRKVSMRLKG